MKGKSLLGIGSILALVLALAATWAWAEGNQVYYACVNSSSGAIKMVGPEDSCKNNQHFVVWNQMGPTGPLGLQGERDQLTGSKR